jgi:Fe-S cluster biogenesis protein NfuA
MVPGGSLRERVQTVIDLIRPSIQADGGDVELLEVTGEGDVTIRLHGACIGCPSSEITLRSGIERNLKTHVPQVRSVQSLN